MVYIRRPPLLRPDSDVYSVPCGSCNKVYLGETGRGFRRKRMNEHRAAIRRHDTSNAFVIHADKEGHLPRWTDANIIANGLPPIRRKILESALIQLNENLNTSPGSHELSKVIATHIAQVS